MIDRFIGMPVPFDAAKAIRNRRKVIPDEVVRNEVGGCSQVNQVLMNPIAALRIFSRINEPGIVTVVDLFHGRKQHPAVYPG